MDRTNRSATEAAKHAAGRPARPDRSTPPPVPGWVKAFGIAAIGVIVVFLAVHLSGLMPMGGH